MPIERTEATYVCDISGLAGNGLSEIEQAKVDEDDPLGDCPVGWTRITITTRVPNEDLAQTLEMYKSARQSLEKDLKGDATGLENALWALDAQFGDFLDQPAYVTETGEMWVHPSAATEAILRLNPDSQTPGDEDLDQDEDADLDEPDETGEADEAEKADDAEDAVPNA